MKKEKHNAEQPNTQETEQNVLTKKEIQELIEEFGLKERDSSLYLETQNERGESVEYHFPKRKKYPRSPKAGGGWIDLKKDIIRKRKELGL